MLGYAPTTSSQASEPCLGGNYSGIYLTSGSVLRWRGNNHWRREPRSLAWWISLECKAAQRLHTLACLPLMRPPASHLVPQSSGWSASRKPLTSTAVWQGNTGVFCQAHFQGRSPVRRVGGLHPLVVGQMLTSSACGLARETTLCLPAASPKSSSVWQSEAATVVGHSRGSVSPFGAVVHRDDSDVGGPVLDGSSILGALSQEEGKLGTLPSLGQPLWARLLRRTGGSRLVWQSVQVIQTIQVAWAGSTTACFRAKWLGFLHWCGERRQEPWHAQSGQFLQC